MIQLMLWVWLVAGSSSWHSPNIYHILACYNICLFGLTILCFILCETVKKVLAVETSAIIDLGR